MYLLLFSDGALLALEALFFWENLCLGPPRLYLSCALKELIGLEGPAFESNMP